MKQLNTSVGTFGGFSNIETLSDRYRCDGVDYQFSVVGSATIEDYVPPVPVAPAAIIPEKTSRLCARLTLLDAGKWSLIQPAINTLEEPQKSIAQAFFEDAEYWYRDDQFVNLLAPLMGMSELEVDALFIAAEILRSSRQ